MRAFIAAKKSNDDELWSSPSDAKRVFKVLRVGRRSFGSMAHYLPRMG